MKLSDEELARILDDARGKPGWARTKVPDGPGAALRLEVTAGQLVFTLAGEFAGIYEFEADGEWILLPMAVWRRTVTRLRLLEPRVTGKGDGGPRRLVS